MGRGTEQTHFQRRHANDQRHMKIYSNIINECTNFHYKKSSRILIYRVMIIVNNTILYT